MSIQRSASFTFDVTKPISQKWKFYRGDALKISYIFKDGANTFDTSSATKLRVQAYVDGEYSFGGEFEPTDGAWIAEFSSSQTALFFGTTYIIAQLMNTTGSQMMGFMITANALDSKTTIGGEVSESFRDQVYDAAEAAEAAAEAAEAALAAMSTTPFNSLVFNVYNESGVATSETVTVKAVKSSTTGVITLRTT